jgi:hypothetical protein
MLAVPPPLRGADAGSFAEHSIMHRLPHIAQRVVADNLLTAAMRHRIADLIAAIPHRTLEMFTLTFRTLFRTFEAILEEPPAERGAGATYRLLPAL